MSKPFRSDKRKKELLRLKKQEEKRQRRFGAKQEDGLAEGETVDAEGIALEGEQSEEIISEGEPSEVAEKAEGEK